jgi:hypothetical protein
MFVNANPLPPALVRHLVALAEAGWDQPSMERFLADRGWVDTGFWVEIDGGHGLFPPEMANHDLEQTGLWVTFSRASGDEDMLRGFGPEWVDTPGGQAAFDATWAQACEVVAAELGPPELTLPANEHNWNIAGWRVGSVALLVGQTQDEYMSQGDIEHAAVWLFSHPKDEAWPEAKELRDWLMTGRSLTD